ncbi:uncharacterized protein [Excalfactoria chinensis]|uniref:uncharacterized protein n=1 Tax=Excalfactoria chinensis TaxID=46218 RepID=UPI003B3ADC72
MRHLGVNELKAVSAAAESFRQHSVPQVKAVPLPPCLCTAQEVGCGFDGFCVNCAPFGDAAHSAAHADLTLPVEAALLLSSCGTDTGNKRKTNSNVNVVSQGEVELLREHSKSSAPPPALGRAEALNEKFPPHGLSQSQQQVLSSALTRPCVGAAIRAQQLGARRCQLCVPAWERCSTILPCYSLSPFCPSPQRSLTGIHQVVLFLPPSQSAQAQRSRPIARCCVRTWLHHSDRKTSGDPERFQPECGSFGSPECTGTALPSSPHAALSIRQHNASIPAVAVLPLQSPWRQNQGLGAPTAEASSRYFPTGTCCCTAASNSWKGSSRFTGSCRRVEDTIPVTRSASLSLPGSRARLLGAAPLPSPFPAGPHSGPRSAHFPAQLPASHAVTFHVPVRPALPSPAERRRDIAKDRLHRAAGPPRPLPASPPGAALWLYAARSRGFPSLSAPRGSLPAPRPRTDTYRCGPAAPGAACRHLRGGGAERCAAGRARLRPAEPRPGVAGRAGRPLPAGGRQSFAAWLRREPRGGTVCRRRVTGL